MAGRSVVVGLLGGIASGKSTVASLLAEEGARVVDADRIAHEVLEEPEVRARITSLFGESVMDEKGHPDRARIADTVFGHPERLKRLEEILHPVVHARITREVGEAAGARLVVLDAPLLLERGLRTLADFLVFVAAPDEARRLRAAKERGWDRDQLALREASQASLEEKERAARFTVVNDGTLESLRESIVRLLEEIEGAIRETRI